MKYLLSLFLFFFSYSLSFATFCVDTTFQEKHINLHLCQNHSSFKKSTGLLFAARAKFLNQYIEEKIKKGELKDKKIEMSVYDSLLTFNHLDISEENGVYVVDLSGYPSLNKLIAIIDYLGKSDWKPLFTGDYQKVDPEVIAQRKETFFRDNNPQFEVSAIKPFTVWSQNNLRIDYVNDGLVYYLNNKKLPMDPTLTLPVSVKKRAMFFENDKIIVMQDNRIVQSLDIMADDFLGELDIYISDDWVKICDGGDHNCVYSYSYKENRFYKGDRSSK